MAKAVPPVDAGGEAPTQKAAADYAAIELRALDADAKAKEHLNREADQRYSLRWLAVAVVVLIIAMMALLLWHSSHQALVLKMLGAPAAFLIAIVIAPVVSMTTLSLGLMVAAFRGFKDGDEKTGISAISEGSKASSLIR